MVVYVVGFCRNQRLLWFSGKILDLIDKSNESDNLFYRDQLSEMSTLITHKNAGDVSKLYLLFPLTLKVVNVYKTLSCHPI